MNLNPSQKAKLLKLYPTLSPFFQQQDTNKLLTDIKASSQAQADAFVTALIGKIEAAKGEIGDKGEKGDKGDSIKGDKGDRGEKGEQGIQGEKGERGLRGYSGEDGKDGKDGKDIVTHETPESLSKKLNTLKESVDVSVIKGAVSKKEVLDGMARVDGRIKLIDQRWHGGGLQNINGLVQAGTNVTITGSGTKSSPYIVNSTSAGLTRIAVSGTVNGSNQTFTVISTIPTWLVIDGVWYEKLDANGVVQWSSSSTTITTQITPNSAIWGF